MPDANGNPVPGDPGVYDPNARPVPGSGGAHGDGGPAAGSGGYPQHGGPAGGGTGGTPYGMPTNPGYGYRRPESKYQGVHVNGALGNNRLVEGAEGATADYQGALGAQMDAAEMYRQQALGNGPSVAQAQLQSSGDANMAAQMQMAAQSRGGNLASAQRAATVAGSAQMQQTRDSLASLRAQEQQTAMQGYAGIGAAMAQQANQRQGIFDSSLTSAHNAQLNADVQYDLGRRVNDTNRREIMRKERHDKYERRKGWTEFANKAVGKGVAAFFGKG